jgi:hypothetical protein
VQPRGGNPVAEDDRGLAARPFDHLIDCASPRRALAIAERFLDTHVIVVEVRQVHDSIGIADAMERTR